MEGSFLYFHQLNLDLVVFQHYSFLDLFSNSILFNKGGEMTLLDLYKQIEYIGNQFNTWEIPMDKEVKLTLNEEDNTVKVEVL